MPKKPMFIYGNSEQGFSLIEVLLTITISILLLELIIHFFMALIKQHALIREKEILYENAQLAEFILRREIQTAGFMGCNKLSHLDIIYHFKKIYLPIVPIQIFSKDNCVLSEIHPESDVVVVEKMFEKNANLLSNFPRKHIKAGLEDHFDLDDPLVISDCEQADVFIPLSVKYNHLYQGLTMKESLNRNYDQAVIGKLVMTAFFVQKTHRKNKQGEFISALYSYDLIHHKKIEWISGVESMQVFAGIWDSDTHAMIFRSASSVRDFSGICLIKIILSLRNEDTFFEGKENFPLKQTIMIYLRELA